MDSNQIKNQVNDDFEKVKKDPKALLNLHWAFPLVGWIVVLLFHTVLAKYTTVAVWLVVITFVLAGWTYWENSKGKPNPIKATWLELAIPAATVTLLLIVPTITSTLAWILFIWAVVAFVIRLPWKKWYEQFKNRNKE